MCPQRTDVRRGHISVMHKFPRLAHILFVEKDKNTEMHKKPLKIRNYL
jgi:hypothetical protein